MQTRYGIRSPTVRPPGRTVKRRRWNALKLIVFIAMAATLCGCAASYILAMLGMDTAEGVTTTLIQVFGTSVIAYAIKTLGDHVSMNACGITEVDEDIGG